MLLGQNASFCQFTLNQICSALFCRENDGEIQCSGQTDGAVEGKLINYAFMLNWFLFSFIIPKMKEPHAALVL
jgi:hypothetical protein